MKVRRLFLSALGVMALASVTVLGGTGSASVNKTAKIASTCTASLAIEGPFTGPVAFLGLEQLPMAQLAVALDNKKYGLNVTLAQDDTQLTPALAVTKTAAVIASNAVALIGPSGSQEVLAVGPALAKAGLAAISPSATNPTLTTNGKDKTFLRVVSTDNIQGPQDANYIAKVLKPKGVLLINDEEVYSTGLAAVMIPILQKAGIKVDTAKFPSTDTGPTLANDLNGIVTTDLQARDTVTLIPSQIAVAAQQLANDAKQQGKKTTVFGTDGTDSSKEFFFPGSYVSDFAPNIATNPKWKSLVTQVAKYGTYGPFGVPSYVAADVEMRAISAVCKAGGTPTRANVLAAIRKTDIPASQNPLGEEIKFKANGDLVKSGFFLSKIGAGGVRIPVKTS